MKTISLTYPWPILRIFVYFLLGSPTDTMLRNFSNISSSDIFFFLFSEAPREISGPGGFCHMKQSVWLDESHLHINYLVAVQNRRRVSGTVGICCGWRCACGSRRRVRVGRFFVLNRLSVLQKVWILKWTSWLAERRTMLLVRSGLLAIGGGGTSSSISELGGWCTGLWYECGAPSVSVGVVLLGLELDTRLIDDPEDIQTQTDKYTLMIWNLKITWMSGCSGFCHVLSIRRFLGAIVVPVENIQNSLRIVLLLLFADVRVH